MRPLYLLAALAAVLSPSVVAQSVVSSAATETALAYVRDHATAQGLAAADAADLSVSSAHESAGGRLTYVYVQQRTAGVDVAEAIVTVALGSDGRVVHAAGDLVSGVAGVATAPGYPAETAVARAAAALGLPAPSTVATRVAGSASRYTVFGTMAEVPVTARLLVVRTDAGPRLAWEVLLPTADGQHVWQVRLDAATGAELSRHDQVIHEAFPLDAATADLAPRAPRAATALAPTGEAALVGSYRVYPVPVESPLWLTPAPPADARTLVANPDNALASPFGWHDTNGAAGAEFTVTRGNNVYAYPDVDNTNTPDATGTPDGGAGLTFDFPLDLTLDPSLYKPAAVTNLFYWNNVIHDILYQHGFTEAAGNFQTNNYGRGGVAFDDAVHAEAQDASLGTGNCNANMWTPADDGNDAGTGLGSRPRMQMYTCDGPAGPDSDGDLDNGVIVHEYIHGLSNRLTGGALNVSCLNNAEQMGEGWSDWYALMLSMRATDTRTTRRPIGNYLLGQDQAGGGIRSSPYQPAPGAPYSTSFAINGATYGSTNNTGLSAPHGVGFVWATILWEVTWDMIDAYGFNANLYNAAGTAGNQMMMRLVTEGLKLQPCSPGFVDGRNAILAADAALYPDPANPGRGLHYATLWSGFARRGLGFSATQGSSGSRTDQVEAFDAPLPSAVAQISPSSISLLRPPGATATVNVSIANTAAAGSQSLTYSGQLTNVTFVPAAREEVPAARADEPAAATGLPAGISEPASKDGRRQRVVTIASPAPDAPDAFGAGGPDAGGYRWDDSNEPGGPVYSWTDISASGTPVTLALYGCTAGNANDEGRAAIALPFAFPFYGTSFSTIYIYANGLIGFSSAETGCVFNNGTIPSATAPNGLIAPFWDDLDLGTTGTLDTQVVGGDFVVQYTTVRRFNDAAGSLTAQVILTPAGEIRFQYQSVPTTSTSATIGIEHPAGTTGLQVANNAAYATANKAVRFRRGRQWVSLPTPSGTLAPGANTTMPVSFDATGLTEGTYTATLVLTTNDPAQTTVNIPVALTVGGAGVVAGAAGWRLLAAPASGVTVDNLAAMNLVQGVPGYYPPPQAQPNLLTGYTGSVFTSAGTGTVLPPGRGFFWYFYNLALTPGGASNSFPLPTTLATTNTPVTTDTPVSLHAAGDRWNLLGNPFGVSLAVNGIAGWPGAGTLSSTVAQTWNAAGSTYETSVTRPTIAPWQGFWVQAGSASTLTIPASARTTGGVLQRTGESVPDVVVAMELATADGARLDRAAVLTLGGDGAPGPDAGDADKLMPMDAQHVLAGFATGADGTMRAVESRPLEATEVPLAVASVGAGAEMVLRWPLLEGLPAGWAAVLRDAETGARVDLTAVDHYAFTVTPQAARAALAPGTALASVVTPRFVLAVGPAGVVAGGTDTPLVLALEAARPNPSAGTATIAFALPAAGDARLTVVDLLGREVAVLAEGAHVAGRHVASLAPARLAPGVYVVRLDAAGEVLSRRVVVVR